MTWKGIYKMGEIPEIIVYHKEIVYIYFLWIIIIFPVYNTYSEKSIIHFPAHFEN